MDDIKELLVLSLGQDAVEQAVSQQQIDLSARTFFPLCLYVAMHEIDNQGQIRYLARILREEIIGDDNQEILRVHLGPIVTIPFFLTLTDRQDLMETTTFERFLNTSADEDLFTNDDEEELMYVKLSPEFHREYNLPELVPIYGIDAESLKSRGAIPIDILVKGMEKILRIEPNHIHRDRFLSFLTRAYIGMGVSLAMEEQYYEAVWQLKKALKIDPDDADTRFHLGNIYFDSDEIEKALLEYRKSLTIDPDSTRTRTYLGIALASMDTFEEALEEWHKVLSQKQENGDEIDAFLLVNMGKANLNLDRFKEAEKMFRAAVKIDPENIQARNHLGITLANLGAINEAIDIWYDILGSDGEDSYLYFNLGRALFNLDNYRKSIHFMTKAKQNIDEPEIQAAIPLIIESAGIKLKQAAAVSVDPTWRKPKYEHYFRAKFGIEITGYTAKTRHRILPEVLDEFFTELEPSCLNQIRMVQFKFGKSKPEGLFEPASGTVTFQGKITGLTCRDLIALAQKVLPASSPQTNSKISSNEADTSTESDSSRREQILEKLKQRIMKNPADEWAYYNLGASLIQYEEMDEALKCFEKAVTLNPNNGMAFHALGLVQTRLGEEDKAIKSFQKAIITVPDSKLSAAYEQWGYKDSLAYFDLGDVLMKKKMYDEAIVSFTKGLDIDASVPLAHYQIGICYLMKENFREAAEAFRNAVLLNTGFAAAYNRLGLSLMRLDQYEQAQDVYQKAVELNPNDLEALFCLGQIAFLWKEFDKARIFLQKVETLAPDNKFAVRARELLAKLDKR